MAEGGTGKRPSGGGGSLISARGIELSGQWGQVFGPLDFDVDRGGLKLIAAPSGAARTALMMALCGRMKLRSGRLTVLGHTNDPHAVFAESSIACFEELDAAQPSVTVRDLVTEQIRWNSPWYRWVPLAKTEQLKEMCGYLFEGRQLPPIDAFVADLPELDRMLLQTGIANTARKPLLVVGRLDHMADIEQRDGLVERLVRLGEKQTVLAANVNAHEYADVASEVIEIEGLFEFQQRSGVARKLAGESGADADRDPADGDETDDGASGKDLAANTETEIMDRDQTGTTGDGDPGRKGGDA